jgi:hypothetical protein
MGREADALLFLPLIHQGRRHQVIFFCFSHFPLLLIRAMLVLVASHQSHV